MQLSAYINGNMESILVEWESFARTLLPGAGQMTDLALRDHAKQMLEEMAEGVDSKQSRHQASEKSKGLAEDKMDSAASVHGTLRQQSGFTLIQLLAEFRALRATVLRRWLSEVTQITEATINDMVRFNEAIDEAVAESAARYTEKTDSTRDIFLAILGHDLRTPLAVMSMAGDYFSRADASTTGVNDIGRRVKRSAATMLHMVNDLLLYSRSQLGTGMPIVRRPVNVLDICKEAVDEVCAAQEECEIELTSSGDLTGEFDAPRLQQVISNLLTNAVQYRSKGHSVSVLASGELDRIVVQVRNQGPVIPNDSLQAIFKPLVQLSGQDQEEGRPSTSLGLGLFIAREITEAHEGTITAQSSESLGTVFTVSLPRRTATVDPELAGAS